MRKYLPYQQYDVQAIERWLNAQSFKGFRLVKMDGVFPQFKKYYDHLYYYRVRYCPNTKISGYSHYWGNLYIYESQSKEELPTPCYEKDSILAGQRQSKPFYALALLVALIALVETMVSQRSTLPTGTLIWGVIAAIGQLVWLVMIFLTWRRGNLIGSGKLNPAQQPPSPKLKTCMTVISIVTIIATAAVALMYSV